jgi:hypothetical protein
MIELNNLMTASKKAMAQNRYQMLLQDSLPPYLCVRPVEKKSKNSARTRKSRIHDLNERSSLQPDPVDTQDRSRNYDCFDERHDRHPN